ncbi:hypothetical protein SAICODRAFT_71726 [Saitoella complicata NRRL Y-17804]|uniref:uncharacterized protein n=1 Tax=Saitoella complicata (strain BCRC 22490 / CBS 7301 / JCM 7358 / NBRC 10748 / NRRL Y-17804) TaxID=698492 RepID=UPI00086769F4|nr:uncharacterized protein SAICODRAFT_71726 [Saitoella complicata NRRL Y-17804]ODQ52541.1 hypothetical protein SAICODRAFT_71726 [Saitoella complicata NRRL Y-17804]
MSSGLDSERLVPFFFTAKQLNKQALKATKDEKSEKAKVKKAIQAGNHDIARIYASNAVRKQQESLNLLRLASRIDAVASRVQTAVTMRNVTGNMAGVVKGMDRAMESMNLEKISMVMEKFESQLEDLDVQSSYLENAMGSTTATATPQEGVDLLMQQVADEAGLELNQELDGAAPVKTKIAVKPDVEDDLGERLRALRGDRPVQHLTMPPARSAPLPAAKTEAAKAAAKAFYCELCDKGYSRISEYEAHLSSYDHGHRARFREMRALQKDPNDIARRREREQRESGMRVISEDAPSAAGMAKKAGGFKKAFGAPAESGSSSGFKPVFRPSRPESSSSSTDGRFQVKPVDEDETDDEGVDTREYDPEYPTSP